MPDKFEGLIGPTAVGYSYGAMLETLLAKKGLKKFVIASAYLTREASEHLLACIYGIPRKGRKPTVIVLVGTKDRFTRKAAIRSLLHFSRGGRRENELPAVLEVLCPSDPSFHVKAIHARYGTRQWAVIGSHNLTGAGMDAVGELGVVLSGPRTRLVEAALGEWVKASRPWTKAIRTYKEARLPLETTRRGGKSRGTKDAPLAAVGREVSKDRDLTQAELDQRDRVWGWYAEAAPQKANRGSHSVFFESRNTLLQEGNLHRGVLYMDLLEAGNEDGKWRDGQKRSIRRVIDTIPMGPKRTMLVSESVISFTVSPEIRKLVAGYKWGEFEPQPHEMAEFIQKVRALRRRKRR